MNIQIMVLIVVTAILNTISTIIGAVVAGRVAGDRLEEDADAVDLYCTIL